MNPKDLIQIAKRLASGAAGSSQGRPKQAELRRAVSTNYYAMFHMLAACCADLLVGATPASRSQSAWRQVYRALDHGNAKRRCSNQEALKQFPQPIQDFAETFATMQALRHSADYDPIPRFSRSQVRVWIEETEQSMTQFDQASSTERRAFAVHVLFQARKS